MNLLMRFHWWCMRQAKRYDRPGYPWRAQAFDRVGGYAARFVYWRERRHGLWGG